MKYSLAFLLVAATVISMASAVGSGSRGSSRRQQVTDANLGRLHAENAARLATLRQRVRANLGLEPSTALGLGQQAPMTHEEYKDAIISFHTGDQSNFERFLVAEGVPIGIHGGLRGAIQHEGVYNKCIEALKKYVSNEGTSSS